MDLNSKNSWFVIAGILAGATLISTGGALSARTRSIGPDRIVSFESLPDGDTCIMPGAESANLGAAIVSMESVTRDAGSPSMMSCTRMLSAFQMSRAPQRQRFVRTVGRAGPIWV